MENVEQTIISQYANSPTIVQLIQSMDEYVDPRTNVQTFYDYIWNVDTAQGFGLDILGRIVGVSRLLKIPGQSKIFGFRTPGTQVWQPFGFGAFSRGASSIRSFPLPDNAYRVLVLAKALSNIIATNSKSLNHLVRNMFPGRGRAYVIDLGGMRMQYTFEFSVTVWEFAMLTTSGVLPSPAGVDVSVVVIPQQMFFGFASENGLPNNLRGFDQGVFYDPELQ